MANKKTYYDITNLLSTQAQYLMLLGMRSNGKSYQVKKTLIENAYKDDIKFVYLRRWKADLKQKFVTSYFEDMPISKLTNRQYNNIRAMNGYIYLIKTDKQGEIEKKKEIGRYCGLNEAERYKSQTFPGYNNIVYEEFITDSVYLDDEPRILQQFVSTVFRLNKGSVFLVGNTISRVCPYFSEWCLDGVLKQKQGTIEIYHYHTEDDNTVDIAVEYCENTNNENVMFFGQSAKQIITGEWDVKEVPKLPRKQYEYEMVYEILLKYQAFSFVIQLLVEPKEGGVICFIYPKTKDKKKYDRIITDEFSDLPHISNKLDNHKRPEEIIINCLRLEKICYSDNLTGSDFKRVISNMKIY